MFGLNVLLGAFGALVLFAAMAATLVLRRRRRGRADAIVTFDDVIVPSTTTFWGGGEWPRIVVRSHGRLRQVTPRPRPVEVVALPTVSPWEPPRAS